MTPKDKVIRYMERYPRQPLRYGKDINPYWNQKSNFQPVELSDDDIEIIKNRNTIDVVDSILYLCTQYDSILEKNNRRQCRRSAYRSAYDVYRHILHYRSDISLLDVMDSMYYLTMDDQLSTSYCDYIRKRVFEYGDDGRGSVNSKDEFGLVFNEWKDINK